MKLSTGCMNVLDEDESKSKIGRRIVTRSVHGVKLLKKKKQVKGLVSILLGNVDFCNEESNIFGRFYVARGYDN